LSLPDGDGPFPTIIETHGGSVEFSGSETTDVMIEAVKSVDAASDEEGNEILSSVKIGVERSGNTLRIETVYPYEEQGFLSRLFGATKEKHVDVDYRLTVPGNSDVDVDGTSTFVKGSDIEGRVSLDLSSGDVELENIGGIVYVDGDSVGYTLLGAHPVSAGQHRIRIVRDGYVPFDTTVFVLRDDSLRLGTIPLQRMPGGARQ